MRFTRGQLQLPPTTQNKPSLVRFHCEACEGVGCIAQQRKRARRFAVPVAYLNSPARANASRTYSISRFRAAEKCKSCSNLAVVISCTTITVWSRGVGSRGISSRNRNGVFRGTRFLFCFALMHLGCNIVCSALESGFLLFRGTIVNRTKYY